MLTTSLTSIFDAASLDAAVLGTVAHLSTASEIVADMAIVTAQVSPDGNAAIITVGAALIAVFGSAALLVVRARNA